MLWLLQSLDTLTVTAIFSELDFKVTFSGNAHCLVSPEEERAKKSKTLFSGSVLVLVYVSNILGLRLPDLTLKEERARVSIVTE